MSCLTELSLNSTDQKSKLHVMEWLPDDMNVKAVLQIAHGIAEHIGRYDTFARFMANNGFAVVGHSHLGHGQSAAEEKDKGIFANKDGWETAVRDMRLVYDRTRGTYPELPYFLLGHSMGSFLARTFLIRYQNLLTGCIISATGQQGLVLLNTGLAIAGLEKLLHGPRYRSVIASKLSFDTYNKRILNPRTPCDWLTRDSEVVDKYVADEDCGWVPTIGLFADMLGGLKIITKRKNAAKIQKDLPILMIAGDQCPVGDYGAGPKKVYALFKDAGLSDVTLKLYEGARHEVLNETNKEEVWQDVLDWIESKMP
jgi:alpha-beta hydrolase superfamily lysophospholipase